MSSATNVGAVLVENVPVDGALSYTGGTTETDVASTLLLSSSVRGGSVSGGCLAVAPFGFGWTRRVGPRPSGAASFEGPRPINFPEAMRLGGSSR